MRNPHKAVEKQPKARELGKVINQLLGRIVDKWPEITSTAMAILEGNEAKPWSATLTQLARRLTLKVMDKPSQLPKKTTKANSPLSAEVIEQWGLHTEDTDSTMIAQWIKTGAPLGFRDSIPSSGVFPKVNGPQWQDEAFRSLSRSLTGWQNYSSAVEEAEDLRDLMDDYIQRGFCHVVPTEAEAAKELRRPPILNKLGVVVKVKDGVKKSRIIWDLKESHANMACSQGERIILPRLNDVAEAAVDIFKRGSEPWIAAVDVRDAFMNIPSGEDKFATAAAIPKKDCAPSDSQSQEHEVVIFDVLVFGSASSPTIWGRYAAWLGRSLAAIVPQANIQIYVDDPCFVLPGTKQEAARSLAIILLWMDVCGYPVKLQKASGGKSIEWVGAKVDLNDKDREVHVTIPKKKIASLLEDTKKFMARPVVGSKQLRSYAGTLSFVAGLVPHLRPFLSNIWAALTSAGSANDRAKNPGKLIHTRRFKAALVWIRALLGGEPAPLRRTLRATEIQIKAEIVTDASPFGIGGVLRIDHVVVEFFALPIDPLLERKFRAKSGESKWNTLWEAVAVLTAARLWLPQLGYGATVNLKSDNLATIQMVIKGKAKSAELNVIAREFALDLALLEYRIHWISSHKHCG